MGLTGTQLWGEGAFNLGLVVGETALHSCELSL